MPRKPKPQAEAKPAIPFGLKIEDRPISELLPYAKNARTHEKEQVEAIAASIREFGFNNPVLVDSAGVLVAGHGRLLAAQRLGLKTAPVIALGHLTPQQANAYRLADNRIAQIHSDWDFDLLRAELAELNESGFDITLTGFDLDDIALPGNETDSDEEIEPPKDPVSQLGDLWILGDHRVYCGDSTSKEAVDKAVGPLRPNLMVTDPPYGVEYDPDWRNRADRANGKPYGARAVGLVGNDDRKDWREAWALFLGAVAYVWHAGRHASAVQASIEASGFEIRCQIIWAKNVFAIGRGDYHWQHEPCWYAVRKGQRGAWAGNRSQSTLWEIPKPSKSETGHSTQKPVECMRRPMLNNSKRGESVYDPFLGSGTTIIAGQMENRKVCGLELNPAYIDVIIQRWEAFTGLKATHESGASFDDIAAQRKPKAA